MKSSYLYNGNSYIVTGTGTFCGWPATGVFPSQRASNAEKGSMKWRRHEFIQGLLTS